MMSPREDTMSTCCSLERASRSVSLVSLCRLTGQGTSCGSHCGIWLAAERELDLEREAFPTECSNLAEIAHRESDRLQHWHQSETLHLAMVAILCIVWTVLIV